MTTKIEAGVFKSCMMPGRICTDKPVFVPVVDIKAAGSDWPLVTDNALCLRKVLANVLGTLLNSDRSHTGGQTVS